MPSWQFCAQTTIVMLDLSKCDGSAGFLVDTNIWIDCMDSDSHWHEWSVDQLQFDLYVAVHRRRTSGRLWPALIGGVYGGHWNSRQRYRHQGTTVGATQQSGTQVAAP